MTPAGEQFAAAIDGEDGVTWRLPLAPLNGTSCPEAYSPGETPAVDRLEAAAKLVGDAQRTTTTPPPVTGVSRTVPGEGLVKGCNGLLSKEVMAQGRELLALALLAVLVVACKWVERLST
jgi:hypothetical protein